MIRFVMKDYGKSSAYLNLRCNAYHWATYLIQHSNFVSDYISIHHLQLSNVKKTIAVMIEGLNGEYHIYQPRYNKLYTNLAKQQYLNCTQLRVFLIDFVCTIKHFYHSHLRPFPEEPRTQRARLNNLFLYLYRRYENTIFSHQNFSKNLKAANYVLEHVNQFVGNHAHL